MLLGECANPGWRTLVRVFQFRNALSTYHECRLQVAKYIFSHYIHYIIFFYRPPHVHTGTNSSGSLTNSSIPEEKAPAVQQPSNSSSQHESKSAGPASTGLVPMSSSAVVTSVPGNFFNSMGSSFVTMVDQVEDGINTKDFVACAAELPKLFGKEAERVMNG